MIEEWSARSVKTVPPRVNGEMMYREGYEVLAKVLVFATRYQLG
jgi:hypothetical protein